MGVVDRDGALAMAIGLNIDDFQKKSGQVKSILNDMTNVTKKEVEESIRFQKKVFEQVERELSAIQDEVQKLKLVPNPTAEEKKNLAELQTRIFELNAEAQDYHLTLVDIQTQSRSVGDGQELVNRQIRNLKSEMTQMRIAGEENTEMYREKAAQLGKLSTAFNELKQEQKLLSTGGSDFTALTSGIRGLTGALTAGAGAFGILNSESEAFAKIQTRVQSMMAITMGLQAVSDTMHKTSAFRIHFLAKIKGAYTASLAKSAAATGVATTANLGYAASLRAIGAAMKAIPGIGWIAAGLSALIGLVAVFTREARNARRETEEFNRSVRELAAQPVASIKRLQAQWNSLGNDLQAKERFIRDNQRAFDELGAAVRSVADAEAILSNPANVQKFINAQIQKAKASVMIARSTSEIEKLIDAERKLEEARANPTIQVRQTQVVQSSAGAFVMRGALKEVENPEIARLEQEVERRNSIIQDGFKEAARFTADGINLMNQAGIQGAKDYEQGTIAYWTRRINERREAQRHANAEQHAILQREIDEFQKQIDAITGGGVNTGASQNQIANLILNAQRQLEDARIGAMQEGLERRLAQSKLDYKRTKEQIKQQQEQLAELLGRPLTAQEQQVFVERIVLNEQARTQRDEQINTEFEQQYIEALRRMTDALLTEEERRKGAIRERYAEERRLANEMTGVSDEQRSTLLFAIDEAEQRAQLDRILINVTDFKRQEADVRARFDILIADEAVAGNEELIAKLEKQRDRALSQIQARMLQESAEWQALFIDLDNLTADQIDKMVANIRASLGDMQLNPQELRAITQQLEQAEAVSLRLRTLNPFRALAEGLRMLQTQNPAQALQVINQALNDINQTAGAVGNSLADIFGSLGNDAAAQKAQSITNIATGALSAGQGIARLASGDIVGGITDLARGIADVVRGISGMSDARRQRNIEELQRGIDALEDRVQYLRRAYTELGREVENAFAASRANLINQQNKNLDEEYRLLQEQNAKIQRQIREENSKKRGDASPFEAEYEANRRRQEEIRRQQKQNEQAARDAIVGTTIMSAINDFANAYVNAWKQGEDAATASTNVARNILINALMKAMKSDIQPQVKRLHKKIAAAMSDGEISDAEQAAIDAYVAEIDRIASQWEAAMRPHIDGLNDARNGVTGELHRKMTEGTGSMLVGLWNMTAMDIRKILEWLRNNPSPRVEQELNAILNELHAISRNTRDTADNTEGIKEQFEAMNKRLEEIKKNIKPNNSRG